MAGISHPIPQIQLLLSRGLLATAAERSPWESRSDKLFWKGANTSEDRYIAATSKLISGSLLSNVHLISWEDSKADFARNFVSLPQHCHHRFGTHH